MMVDDEASATQAGSAAFKRPYESIAVANEFIKLSRANRFPITPMTLQKLSFFAHGWRLKVASAPLVDEEFQAWKLGPVLAEVYHEFKKYRAEPIATLGTTFEPVLEDGEVTALSVVQPNVNKADVAALALIEETWRQYAHIPPMALSLMTHEKDGAWDEVWRGKAVRFGLRYVGIPNHKIRDEFDLRAEATPEIFEAYKRVMKEAR